MFCCYTTWLVFLGISQTRCVLLKETFDDSVLPEGWTITEEYNWSISNSNNAGGDPYELKIVWYANGLIRVVSPVINTVGITDLVISFIHYLDNPDFDGF